MRFFSLFIALMFGLQLNFYSQDFSSVPTMFLNRLQKIDSIFIFKDIPYDIQIDKDSTRNQLDIYTKSTFTSSRPIMFYIHGGGWNSGSKDFELEKVRKILDSGFIFVSTNYRLSPNPVELDNPNRVKFPDHIHDVAKAFGFLMKFLPLIGGDTSQICVIGYSAGGNLALTLGLVPSFLQHHKLSGSNIQCIVNLDGAGMNIPDFVKTINGTYKSWFLNAFGTTEKEQTEASPLHQFPRDKILPPVLIVFQNTANRKKFANQMADSLSYYYNYVELMPVDRYNHSEIINKFMDYSDFFSTEYNNSIFAFIRRFIGKK